MTLRDLYIPKQAFDKLSSEDQLAYLRLQRVHAQLPPERPAVWQNKLEHNGFRPRDKDAGTQRRPDGSIVVPGMFNVDERKA